MFGNSRGTETEDALRRRLANAKSEMDYGLEAGNFEKVTRPTCLPLQGLTAASLHCSHRLLAYSALPESVL